MFGDMRYLTIFLFFFIVDLPKDVTVKADPGFEVNENESLTLHCNFNSYPSATSFEWKKMIDGKEETLGENKSFTINSASPSNSGLYRCEATNNIGIGKSQSAEVKVRCE